MRQAYRCKPTTIQRCQGQTEKFVSISDALKEARQQGSNFVFEDKEDGKVWIHEERLAKDPIDFESLQQRAEVKGALASDEVDILSAYSSEQGFKETTVDKLYESLRDKSDSIFVLDVRTPQEYNAGHVPQALNIALDGLSDAVRNGCLDSVRSRTIAVICASGGRSAQATVRLSRVFNFSDVVNVVGGTSKWIEAGYPIDQAL
ncbi:probable thiosulfate sulfurtransferase GlpE at C-terminar half [Coccomyxa sp. Obi]|nr:probable thiosulfate sulfurtransferase GlpE at C-terminar half [Coccomyxa sp. Obi]